MKITMYELLGMIKNNNAPKQIKFSGMKWELKEDDYYWSDGIYLEEYCDLTKSLNDEVEIIDESKKIEKLDVALLGQCDNWLRCPTNKVTKQDVELNPYIIDNIRENTLYFQRKINELIDEINNLKDND